MSERSDQYSRRHDILEYHPIELTLFWRENIEHNAIQKG